MSTPRMALVTTTGASLANMMENITGKIISMMAAGEPVPTHKNAPVLKTRHVRNPVVTATSQSRCGLMPEALRVDFSPRSSAR